MIGSKWSPPREEGYLDKTALHVAFDPQLAADFVANLYTWAADAAPVQFGMM